MAEEIGHNSGLRAAPAEIREWLARQQDRQNEINQLRDIMKEDFARMNAKGYDTKALRILLKRNLLSQRLKEVGYLQQRRVLGCLAS